MKFGVALPTYGPALDLSVLHDLLVAIETLGYDGAWVPDHLAVPADATHLSPPFLEPLAVSAWAMGLTTTLRVGTDVLVAPYRHPALIASSAETVARLGGGSRFILGVGVGYLEGEFEAVGAPPFAERGRVTDRTIEAVRARWSAYASPIWVGGNSGAARRRAARLGDGWHPVGCSAEEYARGRTEILAWREEAGAAGPFTFSFSATGGRHAKLDELGPLADAGVEHAVLRFGTDLDRIERFAREVAPRLT